MLAILWSILTFVYFLQVCNCSGVVEFRLDRYSFSCSEYWGDKCDFMFTFCFDRRANFDACEYKRTNFSAHYPNQNDITFGSNIGGIPNPIVVDMPSFGDHPRIMVAIRVFDMDDWDSSDFVGEIRLSLKLAPAANNSTATFVTSSENHKGHYIQYARRAYCNSNQYGVACGVTCIAQNDSKGHYSCSDKGQKICYTGWEGGNCTTDINECTTKQGICSNNNTTNDTASNVACINTPGSYHCECVIGWKGDNCMTDIDECSSSNQTICQNGGTCSNNEGSYTCECPNTWTGINCTQDVNECSNTPSQNNTCNLLPGHHTCVNTPGAFHCECVVGWKGDNCMADIDECSESKSTVCYNGGLCSNEPGSYRCNCPRNWTGQNCAEDVDECNTQLVETECKKFPGNWVCTNFPGSYICQCRAGWQGDNCADDINECSLSQMPCLNGGECINLNGSYRCECPNNWTGQNCSEDVDECAISSNGSSLCLEMNKLCQNTMGGFVCACSKGWKGDNCTVDEDECRETINECPNGTECINTMGGFNCDCPSGWGGKHCLEHFPEKGRRSSLAARFCSRCYSFHRYSHHHFVQEKTEKSRRILDHCPHAMKLRKWRSGTVTFLTSLYDVRSTQRNRSTLNPRKRVPSQNSDNNGDTYQDDEVIYHEVENEYNNYNLTPPTTPVKTLQNTSTNSGEAEFNAYDHLGSIVPPAKENTYSNSEALKSASAKTQPSVDQRGYAYPPCQAFSSNSGLKTENNHSDQKRIKAPKQLDNEFQLLNNGFKKEDVQSEFILSKLEPSQYIEAHLAPTKFSGASEAMLDGSQIQAADEDVQTGFDDSDDRDSLDDSPPQNLDQPGFFSGAGRGPRSPASLEDLYTH